MADLVGHFFFPVPERYFPGPLSVIPPAPERSRRAGRSIPPVPERSRRAAVESGHRRNSVRFALSGPSQRQHRPRFAQTCCRRAPPPAPVRGWTGPPVAGSSPSSLSSRPSLCHPERPSCHPEPQRRIYQRINRLNQKFPTRHSPSRKRCLVAAYNGSRPGRLGKIG